MYKCMLHCACATAQLRQTTVGSERTAGTTTPGEGGATAKGPTTDYGKLLLNYCRTQETPGAPEDTRGD
jgi:hypothetical protein